MIAFSIVLIDLLIDVFQAIKLNPNDAETYYQRASMFRKVPVKCTVVVLSASRTLHFELWTLDFGL